MSKENHTIKLINFEFDSGTIPLSFLTDISLHLKSLTEIAILNHLSLYYTASNVKREWLKKLSRISLVAINQGSTILNIESYAIQDVLDSDLRTPNQEIENTSAIGLVINTIDAAYKNQADNKILKPNFYRSLAKFSNIFDSEEASIVLSGKISGKSVTINKNKIDSISGAVKKEIKLRSFSICGTFDEISLSKAKITLQTKKRRLPILLKDTNNIEQYLDLFGKEITITGISQFDETGKILSLTADNIRNRQPGDEHLETDLTIGFFANEEENLYQIIEDKTTDMRNISNILDQLSIEDHPNDLIEMLG